MARLAPPDRDALLLLGSREEHPDSRCLLKQGEHSRHILLLTSGRVRIMLHGHRRGPYRIALRAPGDLVGELAFLDDRPRSASVITNGPVVVRRIPDRAFDSYLRRHPAAHRLLAQVLADRLRIADQRSVQASYDVTTRVAVVLGDLAVEEGDELVVHLTQRELAQLVGAAQVSAHRAVRALVRRGLLRTRHGSIVIRDESGLGRVAEPDSCIT
ncbi:Crp/Fnr family transcriptional regulator [Micromonospora sp. NPDC000207]|uniref:Crp/Fnr family transcriptional regulator n=1 Tax=Micromonospora sp. NPDC000207 TaxID=3154246 RepID=UPI003324CF0B